MIVYWGKSMVAFKCIFFGKYRYLVDIYHKFLVILWLFLFITIDIFIWHSREILEKYQLMFKYDVKKGLIIQMLYIIICMQYVHQKQLALMVKVK